MLFGRQTIYVRRKSIAYPGDNGIVSIHDLKEVRRHLGLSADAGIDSTAFYSMGDPTDAFIICYRGILQRLANN